MVKKDNFSFQKVCHLMARVTQIIFLNALLCFSAIACFEENCPHSTTDTGVHWSRSFLFSYGGETFDVSPTHSSLSHDTEILENIEGSSFLNLAKGSLQFVWEKNGSLFLSEPFNFEGLDSAGNVCSFFSNLSNTQDSTHPYVKFPHSLGNEGPYKISERILSILNPVFSHEFDAASKHLAKAQKYLFKALKVLKTEEPNSPEKMQFLDQLHKKLEKDHFRTIRKITRDSRHLSGFLQGVFLNYSTTGYDLRQEIQTEIRQHIESTSAKIIGKSLFLGAWKEEVNFFRKERSPSAYLDRFNALYEKCLHRYQQEEKNFLDHPVHFAQRRLNAQKEDFSDSHTLPFNYPELQDFYLNTLEAPHVHHSEQLFFYTVNQHFPLIAEKLTKFLHTIQAEKIHGAFLSLFSTRDMCDRCALSLTIDHAHKDGIASKLSAFIQTYNADDHFNPFIVYTVSSRIPYSTPAKASKISSRDMWKAIDSYSNAFDGRNPITLSQVHISLQSIFFPVKGGEHTEDDLLTCYISSGNESDNDTMNEE